MAKKKNNPYNLQPAPRLQEEEEAVQDDAWNPGPKPAFDKGDQVTSVFRPMHYYIASPTEVIALKPHKGYVSGWVVTIKDPVTGDEHDLDSGHFSKA